MSTPTKTVTSKPIPRGRAAKKKKGKMLPRVNPKY